MITQHDSNAVRILEPALQNPPRLSTEEVQFNKRRREALPEAAEGPPSVRPSVRPSWSAQYDAPPAALGRVGSSARLGRPAADLLHAG